MTPPQARWETTDRWHRTFPGKREQVREARRFITAYLEIEDQGGPAAFGLPTPDREGGRGLYLVAALTTAWGVKGDAAGRTVWAELPPHDHPGLPIECLRPICPPGPTTPSPRPAEPRSTDP